MILRLRLMDFASRLMILAAILFLIAFILSINESHAKDRAVSCKGGAWRVLLDDSYRPVDGDECERAFPMLKRPSYTVNYQNGTGLRYHHRTCIYE